MASNNRPPLTPMTQRLNVSRPILNPSIPSLTNEDQLNKFTRTPERTPVISGKTRQVEKSVNNKKLRFSAGNVNGLLTPVILAVLTKYDDKDFGSAGTKQAITSDLNRKIPLGFWQVSSGTDSLRLSLSSFDRKTNLIYVYQ